VRYFADPWRDVPRADDVARVRGRLEELGRGRWIPAVEPAEWRVLDLRTWDWGIAPVEYAANVVLDVLRSAVAMPELRTRWHDVRGMRAQLHRILDRLRRVQRASADHWREAGSSKQAFGEASARELADYAARWAAGFQEELGELAGRLAVLLGRAWRRLDQHRDAGAVQDLLASLDPLAADERAAVPPRERLRRLLALDVVQRTPSADLSGIEQAIELVLMSADAQNAFRPTAKAEDKLAGLQVGHFGAFYKQSWRANDWMWGRLDGADRVVRTLVDPFRIQRLLRDGADLDEVVRRVRAIAVDTPVNEPREWLRSEWRSCEDAVRTELRELLRPGREPKSTDLPATYAALRRRVQLEIVLAELPAVRSAVVADRNEGTAPNAQGDLWEAGLPPPKSLGVAETIAAFRSCPIGAERIPSEVGSDHFTEVSTRALAVTGSVVGASLSVVKPLRPALATLRGVLLALFLLGRGVVASTRSSNFLVALVLAAGGALFAVFLLGTRVPGALGLLGATLLIAGVVLAALRRTWARLVLTALVFVAATLGYRHWHDHPGWLGSTAGVVAVVLMALSAMALGYTRKPRFRRLHRLRRWMHERRAKRRRGQQPTGAPDWDV
jgi:hypothetical protein